MLASIDELQINYSTYVRILEEGNKRKQAEIASLPQLVDKVNKLADTEKDCKTRNRGCKKGSLLSVNDRILQPTVTQEAKISPDFIPSEEIFAFAAFVSGLRQRSLPCL